MGAQLLVLLVAAGPVQPQQRQLHLRVAGVALGALLHEMAVDAAGVFLHDFQKAILPGGLVIGAGGLHQMARAVELVGLLQVGPPPVRLFDGEVGVQIPVLLLHLGEQLHHAVHLPL